jgi:hypothetical protein
MKIKIVSTFSDNGYHEYGKYFVESCKKFIDPNISVCLYIDNVNLNSEKNITILKLEESVTELTRFKERNKNKTFKDYKWDGVRFAHKTYATFHAAKEDVDYLIWLDSDTEIYEFITVNYLLKFLPTGKFVGYLGREGFSETGFLIFDMHHSSAKDFFDRYQWYYDTDSIYSLSEHHDAFVFDVVRKELEADKKIESYNISPEGTKKGHFNAAFDGYMIHYKGDDKSQRDIKISKVLRRKKK